MVAVAQLPSSRTACVPGRGCGRVLALSNPLRDPQADAAYLGDFLGTIEGRAASVGHSCSGAVITNAATGDPDVEALVYVAAHAPAEGESVAAAGALGGGHSEVTDHLVLRPLPGAQGGDADACINPAHFRRLFAQYLPRRMTTVVGSGTGRRPDGGPRRRGPRRLHRERAP